MRKQKFRIKSDWGKKEWLFFELPWNYSESFSCDLSAIEDKSTHGEFTGSVDINGVDIYELDIVKKKNGQIRIVVFIQYCWKLVSFYDYKKGFYYGSEERLGYYLADLSKLEVIGNIPDNPEMCELAKN